MKKSLAILVPFFNESRTIENVLECLSNLPSELLGEVILINDGSEDNSLQIIENTKAKLNFEILVLNKKNGGKASAIKVALPKIESTHFIILDADMELNPLEIPKIWEKAVELDLDYVFGYRDFRSQSSFTYRYAKGNKFISNLYGILFNELISDIMCGYKLMHTETVKNMKLRLPRFAIEIEIPIKLWKLRIKPYEIEVSYFPRNRAEGKLISIKDGIFIVACLIILRIMNRRQKNK